MLTSSPRVWKASSGNDSPALCYFVCNQEKDGAEWETQAWLVWVSKDLLLGPIPGGPGREGVLPALHWPPLGLASRRVGEGQGEGLQRPYKCDRSGGPICVLSSTGSRADLQAWARAGGQSHAKGPSPHSRPLLASPQQCTESCPRGTLAQELQVFTCPLPVRDT